MKLKFFGHSAFAISDNGSRTILIDPFLDGNPLSPVKAADVKANFIILTHAHGDHIGDAMRIAQRCQPLMICVNELANYLHDKGFDVHNMHIGGKRQFDFGQVKFTIAHHGSVTPDKVYAGPAAGVIITIDGISIYHTGDTGLFYDMKLIGEITPIDYLLLPIGDNFTMGIDDAVKAVELVNPRIAIPMHYNTFPVITADPEEFAARCSAHGKTCRIMQPGDEIELN